MTLKLASHSAYWHFKYGNNQISHSLATPQNKFAGPVRYPVASRALRAEWHLSEYIIQKYLRFVHTGHISYVISVSSCTAVCTAYPILI